MVLGDRQAQADFPLFVNALAEPDSFRELLDGLEEGAYLVDRERTIRFWNAASERISGYPADAVVGHRCFENILRHVDDHGNQLCFVGCPLQATMGDGEPRTASVWLHHRDGHRVPVHVRARPILDHEGAVIGAIEFFTDDSNLVAARERVAELETLALVDELTQLPNRRFLDIALPSRLSEARRYGDTTGVVFADLDRFKAVNDTHGHKTGDRVLKMIARTLAGGVRASDVICRFGGEEFVLVMPHADSAGVEQTCDRLLALVRSSGLERENDRPVRVTISMGATLSRGDDDPERILARADDLLYQSKRDGRDRLTLAA